MEPSPLRAASDPGIPGRVPDGRKREVDAPKGVRPSASTRGGSSYGPGPISFPPRGCPRFESEVSSDGVESFSPVRDAAAWMVHPTRLETRTKESNMRASRWVGRVPLNP